MLIFLFICLVYGSVTIGLLAMIANLTPILFILGCMGLTGVSLDYFRLLLATIAIGIAVDDTIHLLNRYKIEFACSGDYRVALERALMGVGPALITTTAILVVAFLSYLYSDLAVLSSFGLLLSGAVCSALIALIALIATSHAWAELTPDATAVASGAVPPNSVAESQAHIAELQAVHGNHGFALAEHWLGLGLAQRDAGDHAGAVDSFSNALQIRRTHLGLHDPGQIPIIDLLIESHRAQGNWEQVDAHFKLLASVHRHELGDEAEQLVAIWQREAQHLPTSTPPYKHLLLGGYAAEQAHDIAIRAYGEHDPRLVEILYLRAAIAYDMARHVSTGDGKKGTKLEQVITAPGLTTSEFTARQNDRSISQRNHIIHNFVDGRVALEAAAKIQQSAGEAIAATLLGDWHFLFDRPQTAAKQYAEAQRLFAASRLAGEPRRLSAPHLGASRSFI